MTRLQEREKSKQRMEIRTKQLAKEKEHRSVNQLHKDLSQRLVEDFDASYKTN
jgi:hypothetical protein